MPPPHTSYQLRKSFFYAILALAAIQVSNGKNCIPRASRYIMCCVYYICLVAPCRSFTHALTFAVRADHFSLDVAFSQVSLAAHILSRSSLVNVLANKHSLLRWTTDQSAYWNRVPPRHLSVKANCTLWVFEVCVVHNMTERPHTSVKAYDCKFQSAIQYDGVTPLPFFLTMSPFNRILISLKKQQNKNIDLYSIFVMKVISCFGRARAGQWPSTVTTTTADVYHT